MTYLQLVTIVMLILQFGCGAAFGLQKCLTWEISDENNILFICRVQNFLKPVILIDNNGLLIANCTFSNHIHTCQSLIPTKMIEVNFTTFEASFYVVKEHIWQYDGVWTCRLGQEDLVTNIDISRGIKHSTDVVLETYITSKHTLLLECSSCRNSVRNSAEFIIDGKTEDTITYDIESGRCIRHKQPCISKQCSCLSTGNEFNMSISRNFQGSKMFSCEMIFVDPITSEKFSKTAEMEFNGTEFIQRPTRTIIIRHAKWNYTEKSSKPPDFKNIESSSIRWTIPLGVLIVLFMVVLLLKLNYRRLDQGNSQTLSDFEITPLLDNGRTSKNTCYGSDGVNLMSESFVRIFGVSIKAKTENPLCSLCEKQNKKKIAVAMCICCEEAMCFSCTNAHRFQKQTLGHISLYIGKSPSNFTLPLTCTLHKITTEYFCKDHKLVCCKTCSEDHVDNCTIGSIKDESKDFLYSDTFKNHIRIVETSLKIVSSLNLHLHEQTDDASKPCHPIENIADNTKELTCTQSDGVLAFADDTEEFYNLINNHAELLDILVKYGTEKQLFSVVYSFTSVLKNFQKKTSDIVDKIEDENSTDTHMSESLKHLEVLQSNFGS